LFACYLSESHPIQMPSTSKKTAGQRESRTVRLTPQGVYCFASPHVGDPTFVSWINAKFPNNRLQRFDFYKDPVTMLPACGYGRTGTRVYYHDIKSSKFSAPERCMAEIVQTWTSTGQSLSDMNGKFNAAALNVPWCNHRPEWYL